MALPPSRHYPGQRVLRISCRTVHIGAAALVLGAATFAHVDDLAPWVVPALLGSGLLIVGDDFYRRGWHLLRIAQFWILILKLGILGLGLWHPNWLIAALWISLIIGSVVSHVPGFVRHFEIWERKQPSP